MSGPQRIAAFVVGVLAVFGIAFGIGQWVGPIASADEDHGHDDDRIMLTPADSGGSGDTDDTGASTATIDLERSTFDGASQALEFTIRDADGEPVTAYDTVHEKQLHLVLVRADLGDYRHVHPDLDPATGEWATDLDLDAGSWRVYADFTPTGGAATVAQADLQVAGDYAPVALGEDTVTDRVDGYDVHLARDGDVLALHVTRGGADVTDLEPYLGAYGHLVVIRAADLGYLHVHPEAGEAGPEVAFAASLDRAGRYRLFFEFSHEGAVHRAEFTVTVDAAADQPSEEGHGDDHGH